MKTERIRGMVKVTGAPHPHRTVQKYWLDSPQYRQAMKDGRKFFGSRYCKFAFVDDAGAMWLQPATAPMHPSPRIQYPVDYPQTGELVLRDYQTKAVDDWAACDSGMLQAPAGSGKTVIGCELIRLKSVRALVVVPTADIAAQWTKSMTAHTGVTAGKNGEGHHVSICTYQWLAREKHLPTVEAFDLIIIDEAHRASCPSIRAILYRFPGRYRYGCTATPWRADGLHRALDWMLAGVTAQVDREDVGESVLPVTIRQIRTGRHFGHCRDYSQFQTVVAEHYTRNMALVDTISKAPKPCIVLANRVGQLSFLSEKTRIAHGLRVGIVTANTPKIPREGMIHDMRTGGRDVLFASYQLASEGLDIPQLMSMVMAAPVGNPTKVEQSCGRIARPCAGKGAERGPVVYDMLDSGGIPEALARKRAGVYRRLGYNVEEVG